MPDLIDYRLGKGNKALRAAWNLIWWLLFRPSPVPMHAWRRFLLKIFGATIESGALPYPSARIWAPWNLVMASGSCLAAKVICYNVDRVTLGKKATVSQNTHICTASHNFDDPRHQLITAPIEIGAGAWVAADVFIGPGVTVAEQAVVLARSVVIKDVPKGMVAGGHPARVIRARGAERGNRPC